MPEAPKEYYDKVAKQLNYHYTNHIKWFPLMMLIVDRLSSGAEIVDLGCGAGHMAELLYDQGFFGYTGLDYSKGMLDVAQNKGLPHSFKFIEADLTEDWTGLVSDYNTVISIELLEHVEQDFAILNQIKPGTRCLLTTTNEPGIEHVRTFSSVGNVHARYYKLFHDLKIMSFKNMYIKKFGWQVFYLLDGIRGEHENQELRRVQ